MSYRVMGRGRNQWLGKLAFGLNGQSYWINCGPATRPTQFNRAVLLMQRLENAQQTSHWLYGAARQLATKYMGTSNG